MPLDCTNYVEPLTEAEQEAKDDLFRWLDRFPDRVPALLDAVRDGWMDGSYYAGVCRCVIGHLATDSDARSEELNEDLYLLAKAKMPSGAVSIESFIHSIEPGDTPSNSPVMAHLERWIVEWMG